MHQIVIAQKSVRNLPWKFQRHADPVRTALEDALVVVMAPPHCANQGEFDSKPCC